ncbi:hypothetical protein BLA29_005008 [Euroglyphus maynei]|uniref:DRBM domain-containing protein n=1 Tax=Euroglyphus maynei TaxID=6958 RepID=A0A1Y3BFP3_EURMA|nr:hypothetical protein BLA29_005008 [Euroglyphus maynei]
MDFSDPIGYLQQLCSKIGWLLPIYKDLEQKSSIDNKLIHQTHCKLNDIVVIGESSTKKNSKKESAKKMIESLNEHYRSTFTVYNLQSGIHEKKIRLLLSDIRSINSMKIFYDMKSKGMAKAEVIVDNILDMLVAMKLFNGYTFQSEFHFYNIEFQL